MSRNIYKTLLYLNCRFLKNKCVLYKQANENKLTDIDYRVVVARGKGYEDENKRVKGVKCMVAKHTIECTDVVP